MPSEYEKILATEEGRAILFKEHAVAVVGELIANLLKDNNMKRTQLAEKMNVTRGRITQILDGDANITLETIARVLGCFGHILEVSSRPIEQFCAESARTLPMSNFEMAYNPVLGGKPYPTRVCGLSASSS
jgi:plasmid maintenance system antidote protein VapI